MIRHRRTVRSARAAAAGFSLIEVLVAVLIVSVGVLGVAGLQLVSLQNNTSAMFRTQGFLAAYEIIDRARANPGQDYTLLLADPAPAFNDCTANVCTPAQMRDYDIATWLNDVAATLPQGDAAIVVTNTVNPASGTNTQTIGVTVQWNDDRVAGAPALNVTVETSL